MKKLLAIIVIISFIPTILNAQCNENLVEMCMTEIGNATVLKEFPVRLKKVKKKEPRPYARFSVSLKKGNQYRLNIKNDSLNISDAIISLSDDHKLLGSSFDGFNNVKNEVFDFYCKKSGTYYVTVQFTDKNGGCAVGLLSYVDEFNAYNQ